MGCEGLAPPAVVRRDDCPVWTLCCLAEAGWPLSHSGGLTLGRSWCAGAGSRVRRNTGGALAAHPSRAVLIPCGSGPRLWAGASLGQ